MAGTGKRAPGWTFKPFVIVNDRNPPWLYIGTRFVSPLGDDAAKVLLFEDRLVAEQVANHLKSLGVSAGNDPGIPSARPVLATYLATKNAAFAPIRAVHADEQTVEGAEFEPVKVNYVRPVSKAALQKRQSRARGPQLAGYQKRTRVFKTRHAMGEFAPEKWPEKDFPWSRDDEE